MENSVPLRGTFGDITIHGIESSARLSVRGTILENRVVVWTHECFIDTRCERLMLGSICAMSLRTMSMKITVIYGGWVGEGFVCSWPLRPRPEGLRETVLGVGIGAHDRGVGLLASMPVKGLSSGSGTVVR